MTETLPTPVPPKDEADASAEPAELSDLDRIKAAQAARRSRRTRSTAAVPLTAREEEKSSDASNSSPTSSDPVSRAEHDATVAKLKQELSTMRLEMSSLRRNHLNNLKKVTEERDMFATQLVREQSGTSKVTTSGANERKVADVEAQLRAARTRNADLEAENGALRDELKQLNFRVQASKTIEAATDGYERIVEDLVAVKLRCAELEEEKEGLLHINKELSSTAAVLTEANGELEKSRADWVMQCADLEKKRAELEGKVKQLEEGAPPAQTVNPDTSYTGSDLQELKL